MTQVLIKLAGRRVWLILPALTLLVGCRRYGLWSDRCEDIQPGAIPAPAGTYNSAWQTAQQARADEDAFVFYRYEWLNGGDQLGPFGTRHLSRLLDRTRHMSASIVVEPSGDRDLDERRVATLRAMLAEYDEALGEYPVVVRQPEAEPMYGFESPRVTRGFTAGAGGQGGGQQGGTGIGGGMGGAGGGGIGGGVGNLGGGIY
jgi:hypothetical protein